ncbi:MAG: hypothetical protein RL238_2992 [Actinomycetota bacterium]|jgi:uncharacterized protein
MAVLPMFPLGSVLLPGGVLPLHVFEPRYRALVQACIESVDHEFGTVLIEQGHEVGGGDRRRAVGTVARIVQVAELPDGRYAVVAVGTHRVRVASWLPDDPYPLADVDDWPDVEPDAPELAGMVDELTPRVRRAAALASELGDPVSDPNHDVSDDPLIASYHLAALAPLSTVDRYDLLCADGPAARLRLLSERLDDVETLLQMRLSAS